MDNFLGEIRMFGGNFNPRGWQLCNGQLLAISANSALFSILGTMYGGNGTSTFGLPDLRGRVPVHQGSGPGLSPYVVGESTGTENVTLLSTQMPQHNHMVKTASAAGDQSLPTNFYLASGVDPSTADSINNYSDATPDVTLNPNSLSISGGSQPHSNLQPLLTVTFIVALTGLFPSRN